MKDQDEKITNELEIGWDKQPKKQKRTSPKWSEYIPPEINRKGRRKQVVDKLSRLKTLPLAELEEYEDELVELYGD